MGDLLFIIYGYSYVTIHHYVMITLYYGIALTISLFKRIFSKLILSLHKTVALSCTEWFGLTPFAIHHQTHCERKRSKLQVCLYYGTTQDWKFIVFFYIKWLEKLILIYSVSAIKTLEMRTAFATLLAMFGTISNVLGSRSWNFRIILKMRIFIVFNA